MKRFFQFLTLSCTIIAAFSSAASAAELQNFFDCEPGVRHENGAIIQNVCVLSDDAAESVNSIRFTESDTQISMSFIGSEEGYQDFCWQPLGSGAEFRIVDEETGDEILATTIQEIKAVCPNQFLKVPPEEEYVFLLVLPPLPASVQRITVKESLLEGQQIDLTIIKGIVLKRD